MDEQGSRKEKENQVMKKISCIVVAAIMTLVLSSAVSWGYEAQKTADGLTIMITAGSYPLVKGDNALSAKVTDGAGKPVADARVTVRFFMPPMPGMAPMSSTTEAVRKGDVYRFTANVAMEGTWKAEVSVARPGKAPARATFNLDSR
jgi:hypothetical protein